MGCVYSRTSRRRLSQGATEAEETNGTRRFSVVNVDDRGNEINPGHIEVTDTDLILRQADKNAIIWPLRSLRRYGFDAELFSFECGRRCPTGPGIYAFRSERAEEIFNILQSALTNVNCFPNHGLPGTPSPLPTTPPHTSGEKPMQYIMLDLDNANACYMNTGLDNAASGSPPADAHYVNAILPGGNSTMVRETTNSSPPGAFYVNTAPTTPVSLTAPKIGENAWTPPGRLPAVPAQSYTTIDFEKTVALSSTLNQRINLITSN